MLVRKKLSLEKGLASDENHIRDAEKIKAMSIWDEFSKKNPANKLITSKKEIKGRIKLTNALKELLKMPFFAKKNKFVKIFDKNKDGKLDSKEKKQLIAHIKSGNYDINNDGKIDSDERLARLAVELYKTFKSKNFNPFQSGEVYGEGVYDKEFMNETIARVLPNGIK